MGTPSAASMYLPLVKLGADRGLRHVIYLRPGYGSSARCEGRVVADCAEDVVAVADALGIERFYTVGPVRWRAPRPGLPRRCCPSG